MHILPVLAGLEVLVLGGGPDIFFFVHLNCASNVSQCPLFFERARHARLASLFWNVRMGIR